MVEEGYLADRTGGAYKAMFDTIVSWDYNDKMAPLLQTFNSVRQPEQGIECEEWDDKTTIILAISSRWYEIIEALTDSVTAVGDLSPSNLLTDLSETLTEADFNQPFIRMSTLFYIYSISKANEIAFGRGVSPKLPVWSEEEPDITKINKRNVYAVLVNAQNQLLVRNQPMRLQNLKDNTKEFIMNPRNRPDLAESPTKAIISLKNEGGTEYGVYLSVYNELKAAYQELWDDLCLEKFGVPYSDDLPLAWRKEVRDRIPFLISEAEPTNFGKDY